MHAARRMRLGTARTLTCTTTRATYVGAQGWGITTSSAVTRACCLQVLMFQEEYDAAVASYLKAAAIDPSLPAQEQVDGIVRQVKRVADLVKRKVGCTSAMLPSAPQSAFITPSDVVLVLLVVL